MAENRVILIEDPSDILLMCMAEKAQFSNTQLPSGFIVPRSPEGKAYFAKFDGFVCQLVCASVEDTD